MGEERDMFANLGWEKEIRSLEDPNVPFNPSPEYDIGDGNQYSDAYEITPFLHSTEAWRWKKQEEHKQYAKYEKRRADVLGYATRCIDSEADDAAKLNEENRTTRKRKSRM